MTKQNNSVRKAEVTPSIRERAERLRDAAGRFIRRQPVGLAKVAPEDVRMAATASPVLVSQVSEWSALQAYMTTTSPMENEDLDEKLNRANELHARICAFEVHSLADMAAKLPVYEDEHDDLKRFDSGAQIERAWDSVIRDIKAVSGRATLASAPDPILAAILETQRLTVARTAALNLELPPGTIDPTPEQDAATDAFFAHVDGVLLKTVPTTAAGCAALARYAVEFLEAEGFVLDEQGSEHVRILKLIARSPLLQGATANHAAPDPVFDAIDRYRIAREAWDAYSDRIERDGWDALGGIKTASAVEGRLGYVASNLATEVLASHPTTDAGRFALAAWIEEWVSDHGNANGLPQDGSDTVFAEVYPALLNAVRVSVNGRG